MNALVLALRQIKYDNRAFWRNPPARVLHLRVPSDVPGDLQRGVRQLGVRSSRRNDEYVDVLCACYRCSVGDQRLLYEHRHRHILFKGPGAAQAHQRYSTPIVGFPVLKNCPCYARRLFTGCYRNGCGNILLRRGRSDQHLAGVSGQPRHRRGHLLQLGVGRDRRYPQRRRLAGHRQRYRPPVAFHLRRVHSDAGMPRPG